MKSIHIGYDLRFLVPSDFETRLRKAEIFVKETGGWTIEAKRLGLFFDLSKIEWIDIGAIVQLILIIEKALTDSINVSLALPLSMPSKAETVEMHLDKESFKKVESRIKNRIAVLDFLKYLRLEETLNDDHVKNAPGQLEIFRRYNININGYTEKNNTTHRTNLENIDDKTGCIPLYKYVFPITWFACDQQKEYEKLRPIANFLSSVIGESKRGLEGIDAETISNVILFELIENVHQHAQTTSFALITAWARPESFTTEVLHYLPSVHPYLNWINQKSTSVIDVIVGDSGKGIPSVLGNAFKKSFKDDNESFDEDMNESAKIILWALDRWSTSKTEDLYHRGTRGLYRVDRIASKYMGIISIRSEDQFVGRDHGGPSYNRPIYKNGRLCFIPGTIIRLLIPSFHEYYLPRITESRKGKIKNFIILNLGDISIKGLNPIARKELLNIIQKPQLGRQPLCIIAHASGNISADDLPKQTYEMNLKESVDKVLREIVRLVGPSTMIITGLPGGWDLIENAINSINTNLEKNKKDMIPKTHDIWDPILVLASSGETAWVGISEWKKKIYNFLSEKDELTIEQIKEIFPDNKERQKVILDLRNDSTILEEISDKSSFRFRFLLSDVFEYISKMLKDHVDKSKDGALSPIGVFLTPSLYFAKKWLNIETILRNTCGSDLTMLLLSILIKNHKCWLKEGPANFILADSNNWNENIRTLQKCLGIKKKEIIPGGTGSLIYPKVKIIPVGTRVIIYFDVISSSEAVERCLRLSLREEAIPVCIACIFDAREERINTIELWNVKVPIISLTDIDILEHCVREGTDISYINPITRKDEYFISDERENEVYPIKRDLLNKFIEDATALHFSHIGRPLGRHFTFYLDASKLAEKTEIYDAFTREIDNWIGHNSEWQPSGQNIESDGIEIWHPEPEPKPSSPARRIAEIIRKRRHDIVHIHAVRREPAYGQWYFSDTKGEILKSKNILIIDWGSLTGNTVMQMIRLAAETNANNIFVCVFLSQLPKEEEAFLRSINILEVSSNEPPKYLFNDIENRDQISKQPTRHSVKVNVKFLSRFPIEAYSFYDCPICQQLIRLSQESYPTELLSDFAKQQEEERLKLRTREEVIATGKPKDFDGYDLDSKITIQMVSFRDKLVKALGSTKIRQEVSDEIKSLLEINDLNNIRDIPDKDYAKIISLIHFLSVETHWLRRPPLYLQTLRENISRIAYLIVVNKDIAEKDRLNAIIVLRTSSKDLFAKMFANIFESAYESEKLIQQLLYDAFTYIVRPYHQAPIVIEPIKNSLSKISKNIKELSLSKEIQDTVNCLLDQAETELAKTYSRLLTPSQAWQKLKSELIDKYPPHHALSAGLIRISEIETQSEFIEKLLSEKEINQTDYNKFEEKVVPCLKSLETNWSPACKFLDKTIFPLLDRIKEILKTEDGQCEFGKDTISELIRIIESKKSLAESEFSKLVIRISNNPHEILKVDNWKYFRWYMQWYWDNILRPIGIDKTSPPSSLIKFLETAPEILGQNVNIAYQNKSNILPLHTIVGMENLIKNDCKVFCSKRLIIDTIEQSLLNIKKHWNHSSDPIRIQFVKWEKENKIYLDIYNNMTQEAKTKGYGQEWIKKRLKAFVAELRVTSRPEISWATYMVELCFEKGE